MKTFKTLPDGVINLKEHNHRCYIFDQIRLLDKMDKLEKIYCTLPRKLYYTIRDIKRPVLSRDMKWNDLV